MLESLKPLAEKIKEARARVSENAAAIREQGAGAGGPEEKDLIIQIQGRSDNLSVCAVDGGLLADRLAGSDIVIRRSVAVNFTYKVSRLGTVKHYPRKFPESEVGFKEGLDDHEAMLFRSLFRLQGEINTAISALDEFKPDFLLLDGSVVLLGSDKPGDGSGLAKDYNDLLNAYKALYQKCETLDCQLIGVIKDSRGKRLAESLKDRLLVEVSDTILADSLLNEMERTSIMTYTENIPKHPVLSGLGGWAEKVRIFYMRPSADDSPLRIEFLKSRKSPDEIAGTICSLCGVSRAFAYPAALVEADMCAALDPTEMEKIKKSLFLLTGGASRPLRRAERPFR